MRDLGKYGALVARHMARWQSSAYAAIPAEERERYFRALEEEVSQRVDELAHSLRPPESLKDTDPEEWVGQYNMARLRAEEQVLAELVYLPPEPGLESEGRPESPYNPVEDWLAAKEQEEIEEDIAYQEEARAGRGQQESPPNR